MTVDKEREPHAIGRLAMPDAVMAVPQFNRIAECRTRSGARSGSDGTVGHRGSRWSPRHGDL